LYGVLPLLPIMPKELQLLEPIADTTPLAILFNEWLAALAPIERITSARRPKSVTRERLLNLTIQLHGLHRAVVRSIELLEAGAPSEKLLPLFVGNSSRRVGIGGYFHDATKLFVCAARGEAMGDATALSRFNILTAHTHEVKAREISAFTPTQLQIKAVLTLSRDTDMHYYCMEDTEAERQQLLTMLRGMLGTLRGKPTKKVARLCNLPRFIQEKQQVPNPLAASVV
jgi:hypothetical protein